MAAGAPCYISSFTNYNDLGYIYAIQKLDKNNDDNMQYQMNYFR